LSAQDIHDVRMLQKHLHLFSDLGIVTSDSPVAA